MRDAANSIRLLDHRCSIEVDSGRIAVYAPLCVRPYPKQSPYSILRPGDEIECAVQSHFKHFFPELS